MPHRAPLLVGAIAAALMAGPAAGAFAGPQSPDGDPVTEPRIVGGVEVAPEGKYPFVVQVRAGGRLCGGALVAADWVLTAAHCTSGVEPGATVVIAGAHELTDYEAEWIEVEAKYEHPDYIRLGDDDDPYDVALLALSRPSLTGAPIALARPSDGNAYLPGVLATVAGWGTTSYGGSLSSALLEVQVPIVSDSACSTAYPDSRFRADVNVCAGYDAGGSDACQGDSGGPLFVESGGTYLHVGVVSWGEGCAWAGYPGVYAETAGLYSWIAGTAGLVAGPTCLGLPVTLDMNSLPAGAVAVGTQLSDVILGTPGPDVIVARAGADVICSGGGDDQVRGGPGDDQIEAGSGNDVAWGGPDDDRIWGGTGNDSLNGGAGDDLLWGEPGDDDLGAGWGFDWVDGGAGNDTIIGWNGDDELRGSYGSDEIWGNDGNDLLIGWIGDDWLRGGEGDDSLLGGGGTDFLRGGPGDDSCLDGEDVIC